MKIICNMFKNIIFDLRNLFSHFLIQNYAFLISYFMYDNYKNLLNKLLLKSHDIKKINIRDEFRAHTLHFANKIV